MWFLSNSKTQHVYYLVSQVGGHTVGRTSTDLVIGNDDSISRNHALLVPDRGVLILTDTGSRYGSYVNGGIAKVVPIPKDQPTELHVNDTVQFGRLGSAWKVGKVHFRCLTSTLVMNDQLSAVLKKVDAELVSSYVADLTHLIMPTITVTTKLLQCLIGQVAIVKPDYFYAVEKCITERKPLPSAEEFIPICTEANMRNDPKLFLPNILRRNLFKGKEFIFLNSTHRQQFEGIVKLAGGVCLSAQREKIAKSHFIKPNVITVGYNSSGSSQSQTYDKLSQLITSSGRRMIPDVEIGLAVIFNGTEKYCNPTYDFAYNVRECSMSVENGETLASSTEQLSENVKAGRVTTAEMNTIPETEHLSERPSKKISAKPPVAEIMPKQPPARSNPSRSVTPAISNMISMPEDRRKSKRQVEKMEQDLKIADKESNQQKRQRRTEPVTESVSYSPAVSEVPETEPDRPAVASNQQKRQRRTGPVTESVSYSPAVSEHRGTEPDRPAVASIQQKRQRRTGPVTESVSYSPAVSEDPETEPDRPAVASNQQKRQRRTGPVTESVSYSPAVCEDHETEPDRSPMESNIHIPETQPAPASIPSQPVQACGFRTVNRQPVDTERTERTEKKRRLANILQSDDNDAFAFEEIAPRKKRNVQPSFAATTRSRKEPAVEEDLFAFNENVLSQQRRTASQRNGINPSSSAGNRLNRNAPISPPNPEDRSLAGSSVPRSAIDSSFRDFIKPVKASTSGWLSVTLRGLKLDDGEDKPKDESELPDETDGKADNKEWLKDADTTFQVRVVKMNLVPHRPTDEHGVELPHVSSQKNFKSFVKKHNYPTQRTVCTMRSFCVLDESQLS